MKLFAKVTTDEVLLKKFMEEKQIYVDLLKERSTIFLEEASLVNLPIYPYKEGFFITVKIEDENEKIRVYDELQNLHIFTVQVDFGLRVAICSVPKRKLVGLAKKINDLI
jgi:aspartate/tyrosine/aromatic aminotransferase